MEAKTDEIRTLRMDLPSSKQQNLLLLDNFKDKDNDRSFRFYTGLSDYATFKIIYDSFGSSVHWLAYHDSNTNIEALASGARTKIGPERKFSPEQESFLVLVCLRLGLLEEDICMQAGISQSQFSRIWITWLNFLHRKFRSYLIWPTKAVVSKAMQKCFTSLYPTTRVTNDCTEIFIEKPGSVRIQSSRF